ncbi:Fanconi anemia group E protein isoform X2 [Synchiropus splendidus]|uniref:Fanconi anemia group E protein isoform X2 n=1 Tax=Synchiropus splendidus TaxID=270530 RepID=UPI00237D573F|nr:Fanconi anemia group E protein isoform X2 [Synchiropus splendidus]
MAVVLDRFEGQSRLLVRELLRGVNGALCCFKRLKRTRPDRCPLRDLLETVCQTSLQWPDAGAGAPTVGPMVWWLPPCFKHNLLSLLCLLSSATPRHVALQTLQCIGQEPGPDPWVTTLAAQLRRRLGTGCEQPGLSPACSSRVEQLSKQLQGSTQSGAWTKILVAEPASGLQLAPSHRKRSVSLACQEEESDEGQQSKRRRVIRLDAPEESSGRDGLRRSKPHPHDPDTFSDPFPAHMKWDQNCVEVFKVVNDFSPKQIEAMCLMLNLSEVTDRTLLKLCDGLQSLELSYSSAVTLIRSLVLQRVLTLTEPASRTLLTAMMSLCLRYAAAVFHAVFGPVLEEAHMGSHQAELLNQLSLRCFNSQYKLLLLQFTLKLTWTESSLSVLHCVLNSKLDVNPQVFGQLVDQLSAQGLRFSNSSTFAKILLTMLTQYSCHVTVAHKHSLSSVLMLNETFLKKSLQAALKRI